MKEITSVSELNINLDRDIFLRNLIRELAGTLEDVVGYDEAAGYISLVGQYIGEWINEMYKNEMGVSSLSSTQVADVLVDLKLRIQGEFSVTEHDDSKIVLKSAVCPFESAVIDRPSMCMMTSNVFGLIAAENLGYAKVVLQETIANNKSTCTVIVHLKKSPESEAASGREYFKSTEDNAD